MIVIYGLLGLGLIIFIHESGHFLAARFCGVTVESFSIGMGPVLFHKKIKQTDYRLSLIPLGGYCGMKGQKDFQLALDENQNQINGEKDSFYGTHPFKRIIIAFFGPFFNFVFACLAFSIIAMIGFTYYSTGNKVIMADEIYKDMISPAHIAGMQTGDKIISIDNQPINYFSDISEKVSYAADTDMIFTIDRNGEIIQIPIHIDIDKETGSGRIGIISWTDPIIAEITKGSIAENSGLMNGDIITSINSKQILNTVDIQQALEYDKENTITYYRNSKNFQTSFILPKNEQIGISFKINQIEKETYSFFPAIIEGIKEASNMFALTIKSIGLLFKGVNVKNAVSGPVRITVMLGDTVKTGFQAGFRTGLVSVLQFLALISISLFLMNLLPIPILDGGLILFAIIEIIIKKQVSPKLLYYFQFIGLAFILCLFVLAMTGDISYIINLFKR